MAVLRAAPVRADLLGARRALGLRRRGAPGQLLLPASEAAAMGHGQHRATSHPPPAAADPELPVAAGIGRPPRAAQGSHALPARKLSVRAADVMGRTAPQAGAVRGGAGGRHEHPGELTEQIAGGYVDGGRVRTTMVEAAPQQTLEHAAFLRRLAEAGPGSPQARLGHGAFLTLRLVDLLDPAEPRVRPDVFGYQLAAMDRACRELPGNSTETAHLIGLIRATADAFRSRDSQLVVPALLAYAHYLEDELMLSEALDVLGTAVQVGGESLRASDRVASRLRMARVLRKLNEFDGAEEAYDSARAVAVTIGDRHAELISRLGQAQVARGRGNLSGATLSFAEVLGDAESLGDQDAQARAHQEIAVVLSTQGQPALGIPHA